MQPEQHQTPSRRGRAIVVGLVALAALVALVALTVRERAGTEATAVTQAPAAEYVGSATCAECHLPEVDAWRGSDHDLAMQPATVDTVLGDFGDATFTYAETTTTFSHRDGAFIVNTDGPTGDLADYTITYTFGVHPLQQYLVDFPDGRKQALSIAWDSRPADEGGQRWFHLYPNDDVKAGDWLHWTNYSQNWNFTCAECHSTDLRKSFDSNANRYDTTWAEIDVACEACHGPGSNHLVWARHVEGPDGAQTSDAQKGLVLALDERRGVSWIPVPETGNSRRSVPRESSREIDMCARCHALASRLTDDYVYGQSPLQTHRLTRLDEPQFWPDGQMRGEVYNWGPFLQSKMYAQGVTCSDCHDPHSLKLRVPGDGVCGQCHAPTTYAVETHTHHPPGSTGAACPACHMPTTTYMVVDPRHDHSMRIPRPDLSAALGTPNPCTGCHTERSAEWAADTIAGWTGTSPSGYQRFGAAFAAATQGAPGAREGLVAIIEDPDQPALVRASAIDRLAPWLTPGTVAAVTASLNDPDPLVVLAAVEALGNADSTTRARELPPLLESPVRSIRASAANALAGAPEGQLSDAQRVRFEGALKEYTAIQEYNADRPEAHVNLANLLVKRGENEPAIGHYRQAIHIDPLFVPAYANLADLLRRTDEHAAEALLRQGLQADPRAGALYYALGLSLARQKRTAEMLEALQTAVELEPDNGRFAYAYAVALHDAGRWNRALDLLARKLERLPHDRDVLMGLVLFSAQAGNRDAARTYVRQLAQLEPNNPHVIALERQLASP